MKQTYIACILVLLFSLLLPAAGNSQLEKYNEYKEKVYIQTDHVIYAPGNELFFKLYLVEAATQLPSVVSDVVYAEILSPSGTILKTLRMRSDEGNASGSYYFPSTASGGIYKIRAYTSWMKNEKESTWFTKEITVQKLVAPRVLMKLDFPKKGYGPGDTVTASYSIRNLNNQPIALFPAKYTVSINGTNVQTSSFTTDTAGKSLVQFTLPDTLNTTDGLLNITVLYDSYTESISRSIPISLHKADLQLLPEGGTYISGYPANIAFIAVNEYGKPTDVKGVVKDSRGNTCGQLESYHDGMGSFPFTARAGEQYHVELTEPSGINQHYALPQAHSEGVMMHVETKDSVVRLRLTASSTQQVTLTAGSKNKVCFCQVYNLQPGAQWFEIPAGNFPPGIARFTLSTLQGVPFAERIAFLHTNKQLHVYITTDKQEYSPREKVTLYVTTMDENNTPVASDCSLSVIDDKLWSLADDKQDHIISWLMMSSELKGKIEEPAFYFKKEEPKSLPALDFVMLTHGYRYFDYADSVMARRKITWSPDYGNIIGGTITDTSGKPVAATVYLLRNWNSFSNKAIEQRTGDDGIFFFTNLPGSPYDYVLLARSNNKNQLIKIKTEQQATTGSNAYTDTLEQKLTRELPARGDQQQTAPSQAPPAQQAPIVRLDNFTGNTSSAALNDVVVVGYGVASLKRLTTSVVTIHAKDLDITGQLSHMLEGKAAGLVIENSSGSGTPPQLTIRGATSVSGNNQPLWVVDGVPLERPDENFNTASINDITILKDATATAIYGSRAVNGVILVNTIYGYRNKRNFRLSRSQSYYASTHVYTNQSFDEARRFYMPLYSSTRTKLKSDFRETLYWNPIVQTDSCGEAVVTFYNSDATTTFRAIAEGIGYNGRAGRAEATYAAKPAVSIDAKIPPYFSTGDTAYIPLNVKNNRKDTFLATVNLALPATLQTAWFDKRVYLLPDSSAQILIPLIATRAINGRIDITVNNYRDTCTLELPVTALDKGYPVSTTLSGNTSAQKTFQVNAPAPGTLRTSLSLYQNLEGQLLDGLESMLAEPHGCFEQTSSATYPNLYILKYLKATGKASPELEARARKYLQDGYNKLISYETREKGFEWFGNTPASETLTAYGLMEFTDMQEFIAVDPKMLARTKAFLLNRRDRKGGFTIKHNQFHSVPEEISSLYIVYALTQAGIGNEIQREYQAAVATALKSNDTYQTAMMALAASSMKDTAAYRQLITAAADTWVKPNSSIVRSGATSSRVEAAALYTLALARAPQPDFKTMSQQISIILAGKNYFGYGSTQATVLALKAIMSYSMALGKAAEPAVTFTLNNRTVQPATTLDSLVKRGSNLFSVHYDNDQDVVPYNLKLSYFSLQPPNSPEAPLQMQTKLQTGKARVGETVRLEVSVANTQELFLPMSIAKIGIPAGLTVQPWQLKQLTERKEVAYYEIFDNYLVLYWMGFADHETKKVHLDLKAEIPGTYTGRAGNTYLYYTPEFQYWNEGLKCTILP